MDTRLKHYVYISDMKVDMLYSQIGRGLLEKIAVELSIDLKPLLGSGIGATIKPNPPEETRYSKLRIVVEYIEKHLDVGWVDAPGNYFKGSLDMAWGLLYGRPDDPDLPPPYALYFAGETDRTVCGMVGSVSHMIGSRSDTPKSDIILHYIPSEIVKAIAHENEPSRKDEDLLEQAILMLRGQLANHKWEAQPLEFLAKKYVHSEMPGFKKWVLLGSPLYVAFTE